MAITDKSTIRRNTKGQRSMSNTTKLQDLDMNSFDGAVYIKLLSSFRTYELELVLDAYVYMFPQEFERQIELIKAELAYRETPMAKELE
jgi:hypothetical protein